MSDEVENSKDRGVYKAREYELYATWKSLPPLLRGQPRQILEKHGIDDENAISLLEIKSQTEFAKRFDIKDPGTLTDWNKRLSEERPLIRIHPWARNLTSNVIWALYKNAVKNGKAAEVKAWMENIENI